MIKSMIKIKSMKTQQRLKTILFSFFVVLLLSWSYASVIYTDISQDSLTLGEKIELTVSLVIPSGAQIIPPETDAGIGKFTVKSWDSDRIARKTSDSLSYKYLLTIYEVEQCSIPALPFVEVKDDRHDTLYSDTIPMRVISVIVANKGDTITLKDIKPQLKAGRPSLLWLWILLFIGGIVGLIFLIRYLWLRSRKPPPPPPPKPPYEEAIEALARLEDKQLLTKGLLREYVFELSEILKRYTGRRFECNAAEYTTEEMLQWLPFAPFDAVLIKSMEWFFDTTHPVKFARMVPDRTTVKQLYDETRLFIEKTKPGSEKDQKTPGQEGGKK